MANADGSGTRTGVRRWLAGAAILAGGAALSWLVIAMSFDPLFVTGSTEPATILGPALGLWWTVTGSAMLLGLGAFGRGRRRLLLVLWLLFLATATHRVVARFDGRVEDVWLTLAVQTLAADETGEPTLPRCTIERWLVRCVDPATGTLVTPTLLPFTSLLPGKWERAGASRTIVRARPSYPPLVRGG